MSGNEKGATWLVGLWLANDYGLYQVWKDRSRMVWEEARAAMNDSQKSPTPREATRDLLAKEIHEQLHEAAPSHAGGMYGDLLTWALGQVDWSEVAEHFMAELDDDDSQSTTREEGTGHG